MANVNQVVSTNYSLAAAPNQQYGTGMVETVNHFNFSSNQTTGIIVCNQTQLLYVQPTAIGTGTDTTIQCTNTLNSDGTIALAGGSITLSRAGTVTQDAIVCIASRI